MLVLVVGYVAGGIALVLAVWRRTSWRVGSALAVTLAALPFVDAHVGRIVLSHKCENDGKISIREKVRDVDGIGVQYGVHKDSPKYYGYQYVEGGYAYRFEQSPYMFSRATRTQDGNEATIEKNIQPRARYLLHNGQRQDSWYFFQERVSIQEIGRGRELSGFNWYQFRGGWAEQFIGQFFDSGPRPVASCGDFKVRGAKTQELLHATLQPASNPAQQPTR